MSRRRKRSNPGLTSPGNNWRRDLVLRDTDFPSRRTGPLVTLEVFLPRPVALRARREIYPYPYPLQKRLKSRVIRHRLWTKGPMVKAKVRVRLPRKLPLVRGSYVSLDRGRLNIHSRRQHELLIERRELNRLRKEETKGGRRKARYGQLDSPGATGFGSVAEGYRRGHSVGRIADAALVARAILKGGV